jgi:hypothetical protein
MRETEEEIRELSLEIMSVREHVEASDFESKRYTMLRQAREDEEIAEEAERLKLKLRPKP